MEELLIKKVTCGIRAIKLGTKTPEEARVGYYLNRLREMNSPWYDEYLKMYISINKLYNEKKNNKK